jgi:uncharacterized protein YdaU (DUF1376 family)
MGAISYVRFYATDWRSGCIGLTMEQEGFYIRMCAFVFETGRRLPLNDSIAAKIMGVHTNAYRKVLKQLIEIGKVKKYADGYAVDRAEKEHVAAAGGRAVSVQEREADGQTDQDTGWETRPDTLADTPHNTPIDTPLDTPLESWGVCSEKANKNNTSFREPEPVANNHKKDTPKSPSGMSPFDAFATWNDLALKLGLPQANAMTPQRRKSIGARLREFGDDGWTKALAHIEQSAFLTGANDRGWSATLDWAIKPANYAKLVDGAYGNGRHISSTKPIETPLERIRRLTGCVEATQ